MRHKFYIPILLLAFYLTGCTKFNFIRTVSSDNVFTSSNYPNIRIKINPSYRYLGEIKEKIHVNNIGTSGTTVEAQSYIFATGSPGLDSFIFIAFFEIPNRWYWTSLFPSKLNILNKEIYSISDENYASIIHISHGMLEKKVSEKLLEHGYIKSEAYISKVIGKRFKDRRLKVYIQYSKDLSYTGTSQNEWNDPKFLTKKQKNIINDLENDFKKDVIFLPTD